MSLPASIDVDELLKAIPGESPSGVDLNQADSTGPIDDLEYGPYEKLLDWRRNWKEAVLAGKSRPGNPEWSGGGGRVLTWSDVIDPCVDLLSNKSKDLRVASLLAVALTYRDGISGLRDSLRLLYGLVKAEYETYPRPLIQGLKSVAAVANTLAEAITTTSLTVGQGRELTHLEYEVAEYMQKNPDDTARFRDAGAASMLDFNEEFASIDGGVFRGYQLTVDECNEAIGALVDLGDDLAAIAAEEYDRFAGDRHNSEGSRWASIAAPLKPSSGSVIKTLISRVKSYIDDVRSRSAEKGISAEEQESEISQAKSLLRLLQSHDVRIDDLRTYHSLTTEVGKCLKVVAPYVVEEEVVTDSDLQGDSGGQASHGGEGGVAKKNATTGTREEAMQKLEELRNFFRRTEPHTVMPYILERAVAWGRMSFPQLLAEVVGDRSGVAAALLERANVDIGGKSDNDTSQASTPQPVVEAPPENYEEAPARKPSDMFG